MTALSERVSNSLVCGLVGLFLCAGLAVVRSFVAVLTGHKSIDEAKSIPSAQADRGFACLGLVTGHVGFVVATWIGSIVGGG